MICKPTFVWVFVSSGGVSARCTSYANMAYCQNSKTGQKAKTTHHGSRDSRSDWRDDFTYACGRKLGESFRSQQIPCRSF